MDKFWNSALDYWFRATDCIARWPGAALGAIVALAVIALIW